MMKTHSNIFFKLFSAGLICLATLFAKGAEFFLDFASQARGPVTVVTIGDKPETSKDVQANDGMLRSFTMLPSRTAKGGGFGVGDRVSIKFFDDVVLDVEIIKVKTDIFGTTCIGAVDGMACVTLIESPEGLCIDAQNPENGRIYGVTSSLTGAIVKESVQLPTKDIPSLIPEEITEKTDSGADGKGVIINPDNTDVLPANSLIDVMIAYEKGAQKYASANGGITNFARRAVAKLNTAIANTDLDQYFNFRLVGIEVVDETESDLESALVNSKNGYDNWVKLHQKRLECGADIVSVLIDTGSAYGVVGIGYSLSDKTPIASFGKTAFNASSIRSVATSHTMTHEIGHNLGAGHSNKQASDPGPQWSLSTKPYSSGYYFVGANSNANYGTVMAYDFDGYDKMYTILPIFSSPNHTYDGTVVGTNKENDNTRVIRETYYMASQWTEQVIPLTYGLRFSEESETVFNDFLEIVLTPEVEGQSIYYTLDGSTPTLDSLLYSAPIFITDTTTIKAVTYNGSDLSPVFEATYYKNDVGEGLDAPQLEWIVDGNDWQFTTEETSDGEDAVKITAYPNPDFDYAQLSTRVIGPTEMTFNYKTSAQWSIHNVAVYLDGSVQPIFDSYEATDVGVLGNGWKMARVQIPEGEHLVDIVSMAWSEYPFEESVLYLDKVQFDAISAEPVISPTSTDDEYTARVFTGSLEISISAAEGSEIYYTLDGTVPTTASTLYTGPFEITQSVWVSAIAIQENRDPSLAVKKMYLERHIPVDYGEWITDFEQVFLQAPNETNAHILITATDKGTAKSDALLDVIFDPSFLSWAKANKYYLLLTDKDIFPDYLRMQEKYRELEPTIQFEGYDIPAMLVCDYTNMPLAHFTALFDGSTYEFGPTNNPERVVYNGTVPSLIELISKTWTTPLLMPSVSSDEEMHIGYPIKITLSHENETGEIYYTLDGTPPDMDSTLYGTNDVIIITKPTTLQAAVWASPTNSSPVLLRKYYTINDVLKLPQGVTWELQSFHASNWGISPDIPNAIRSGSFSDNGRSAIIAKFAGKGKLTYTIDSVSHGSQNRAEVYLNGVRIYKKSFSDVDRNTRFSDELTHEFTDDGTNTVRWVFDVGYVYALNGDYAQISSIKWEPEVAYTATPVPVPYDWIKERNPGATTSEEIETSAATDEDGDGYLLWEEYLAGSDPYDPLSYFWATIEIVNDEPVVSWNIDNSENADYTVLGSDDPRGPFVEPVLPTHQFFKVRITPKAQE